MMEHRDAFKEKLLRKLPTFILIYCLLQPLLDVAGYWQMQWEVSNLGTTAIRTALLVGSVLLGFVLSDRKRYYFLVVGVLALLFGLHVFANLPNYVEWPKDVANIVRIYLMPLTVLCFITFLRQGGDRAFRAMRNGMLINLVIIAVVELLSVLTGTDRQTYHHEGIGVLGWFFWANSQSAILSIMAPITVCWALKKWPKRYLPALLATILTSALLYFFGTRLTYFTMIASNLCVAVCLQIISPSRWKQALMIALICAIFVGGYFYSPMKKRMDAVSSIENSHQKTINSMNIEPHYSSASSEPGNPTAATGTLPQNSGKSETEQPGNPTGAADTLPQDQPTDPNETKPHQGSKTDDPAEMTKENKEKLDKLYYSFLYPVVTTFGYDRVEAAYDYTTDASVLGNWRIEKLTFCSLMLEDGTIWQRLFGMNVMNYRAYVTDWLYNSKTDRWESGYLEMDVENDFHGIYFLLGIVSLVLMIAFLLYFGLRGILAVVRDRKRCFNLDMVGFAIAYGAALGHAYFTVSVLRRNNASVYLAMVLAAIWYLSQRKQVRELEPAVLHEP